MLILYKSNLQLGQKDSLFQSLQMHNYNFFDIVLFLYIHTLKLNQD